MGELHLLDVGFGDASILITDSATFLVDCHRIGEFAHLLPVSKNLRGVIITHQHQDHYSGLKYLRENGYTIDILVFSPYERRYGDNSVDLEEWQEFNSHKDYFEARGTKLHSPYQQSDWSKPWWSTNGAKFWVIGPNSSIANSDTRELHDASLVVKVDFGDRHCLFTGDASDINLEYISQNVNNYCNDILHASHHGSLNGAHLEFIKGCKAKYTLISTRSGVYDNVPHQTALNRYDSHTAHFVRRTDTDGSRRWEF